MSDTRIILMGEGYQDFYQKSGSSQTISYYDYDTATGTFDYDWSTGLIVSAGSTFSKTDVEIQLKNPTEKFESYFDTVNIVFNQETIDDRIVKMFLKSRISFARLDIQYASDSNFVFTTAKREIKLGEKKETGAFENDTVRYQGTKQIAVSQNIAPDQRVSRSIAFRVTAKLVNRDTIYVHSIDVLPSGMLEIGGEE